MTGTGDPTNRDVLSEQADQRPPAGRELGETVDLDVAEDRGSMRDAGGRGGDNVAGAHHPIRQVRKHRCLETRNGVEPQVIASAGREVNAGAPCLVQSVGRSADHARQRLDPLELAHRGLRQDRLDGLAERLVIDRAPSATR